MFDAVKADKLAIKSASSCCRGSAPWSLAGKAGCREAPVALFRRNMMADPRLSASLPARVWQVNYDINHKQITENQPSVSLSADLSANLSTNPAFPGCQGPFPRAPAPRPHCRSPRTSGRAQAPPPGPAPRRGRPGTGLRAGTEPRHRPRERSYMT